MQGNNLDKNTQIGWIGTGVMGFWMCKHIQAQGFKINVFNRTKEKAAALLEAGAVWKESPAEVAAASDVIFTIVGMPDDVREVYFGGNGIFSACSKGGKFVVDMTTTKPSLAVEIYNKAQELHCYAMDAPVSGGDIGAKEARLTIMTGGSKESFDYLNPLFSIIGKNIKYSGTAGMGQHTKVCNQISIAGSMIGMCEALLYGYKSGLNVEEMINTIKGGAAATWSLENYAPRIVKKDYKPGFMVEHFIKDLEIALEESKRMDLNLPGIALARQLYVSLREMGHGKLGTHALILALEKVS